jgi:hypothetical protein
MSLAARFLVMALITQPLKVAEVVASTSLVDGLDVINHARRHDAPLALALRA